MALHGEVSSNPLTSLLAISIALFLSRCIYRIFLHPLSHTPGPLFPKISSLWLYYHAYIGDEASSVHALHLKYGPLVRVSPNEIDISDADAIAPIYVSHGGFPKAPCNENFHIDGYATIFSTRDPEHRSLRAKAVLPLFSTKSIRDNAAVLYGCVDRMVGRLKEENEKEKEKEKGRANLLNLARSLALDVVSTHLFGKNYNGTQEKGKLSASPFVDSFVAVGRFFYLPNSVFLWLEWAIEKLAPDEQAAASMEVVDKFVENMVDGITATAEGAMNYPGRLMGINLERSEIVVQCKDLMFAGTDSTGMNLAIMCRELVLNPDKYKTLREEIESNSKLGDARKDIQSLPYLSGVVREVLRLRTPIPAGSIVGCSAYELHLNPSAFPSPFSFQPERWLEGNVTAEANKHWFAFGAGARACIARNLATVELFMVAERVVISGVLEGARVGEQRVEIWEWFNSAVKGHKIELVWE